MSDSKLRVVGLGGTVTPNSKNLLALKRALSAVEDQGAETSVLDLSELALPIYDPRIAFEDSSENVQYFIEMIRSSDAMIWSTSAYHGTIAGVTKNAIDYIQMLSKDPNPYLHEKSVGLISVADGTMAGANTLSAMVHSVHALRGVVVPLMVAIPHAWKVIQNDGTIADEDWDQRLQQLGTLVVSMQHRLKSVHMPTSA